MNRTSLVAGVIVVAAAPAYAHFKLTEPTSYDQLDTLGSPQKSAPCGQADPGQPPVPTNMVTTVMEGSMLKITFDETIFHPGHYRVAIAQDMNSLPADPVVTPGTTACGSTVIDPNPTLPLLGDGLLLHTAAFNGTQTMMVPLPPGMTCDNCVLQVTEFMSNHPLNNPGGCFYHHCATVTVSANAPDAGMQATPDAGGGGGGGGGNMDASGGCNVRGSLAGGAVSILLVAGVLFVRRRRH